MRAYQRLGVGLGLALLLLGIWVWSVTAQEYTSPYIVENKEVGGSPDEIAVNPLGYTYVTDSEGRVLVLDKKTVVTDAIQVSKPQAVAVDSQQGYAYVSSGDTDFVAVLQGAKLKTRVNIGARSGDVAVLTSTGYTYVSLPQDNQVAVIYTDTGAYTYTKIAVGQLPNALAVNPHTGVVYVLNQESSTVSVIQDTEVKATLAVGITPTAIALNPENGYVYVANYGDDSVSILQDTQILSTVENIPGPSTIALNTKNGRVYVANEPEGAPEEGQVTVLDGTTEVATVNVGRPIRAMAVDSESRYAYIVTGLGTEGTVVIMSDTLLIETFLPVGYSPRSVAADSQERLAYVTLKNGRVVVLERTPFTPVPLDPDDLSGSAVCAGTHGLAVRIEVPKGALSEFAQIICTALSAPPISTEPEYRWAEQAFRIAAYRDNRHVPDLVFDPAHPITLAVSYDPQYLGTIKEADLLLRVLDWDVNSWVEDGVTLVALNPVRDVVTVTLAHLSEYALVAPIPTVYLPLVIRQ